MLFTLDPQSYEIALSQADAALATARVNVEQLRVGYAIANAKLDAARATLDIRQKEWDRAVQPAAAGHLGRVLAR